MTAITEDTILAFPQLFSMQSLPDGAVILLADSGQLYTTNRTAEAILRRIDGRQRICDLAAALCEEFDITPAVATADIVEMAERMVDEGVLTVLE